MACSRTVGSRGMCQRGWSSVGSAHWRSRTRNHPCMRVAASVVWSPQSGEWAPCSPECPWVRRGASSSGPAVASACVRAHSVCLGILCRSVMRACNHCWCSVTCTGLDGPCSGTECVLS